MPRLKPDLKRGGSAELILPSLRHAARVLVCAGMATLSLGGKLAAQDFSGQASDEYLLLGDTNRGAGEAMIAINPKNPKNIIVVGMSDLNSINGVTPPPPLPPGSASTQTDPDADNPARVLGMRTPGSSIMTIAITRDGGVTWEHQVDNLRQGQHSRCADPTVGAGPDGALYIGCVVRDPITPVSNDSVAVSRDEGRTWSRPTIVIGNDKPFRPFAPGLHPIRDDILKSPVDRPWLVIDQSSNVVYNFTAGGHTGQPPREQSYFVATRDDEHSWDDPIRAVDSPLYPQMGQAFAAAANGVFAAVYLASKSPSGASCPCLVFATSTDQGKTFSYSPVPTLPVYDDLNGMNLVADASRPGRFAILTQDEHHKRLLVSQTDDGGRTWSPMANAGEVGGAKIGRPWPWMAVSDKGDIAVVWQAEYPDKSFNEYSTLSRDGGRTFSAPLRVTHATSPRPIPQRSNFGFGDDMSAVAIRGDTVHLVWADYRAGFEGTWYATVPVSAYSVVSSDKSDNSNARSSP